MLPALNRGNSIGDPPSHVALIAGGIERWAAKQDLCFDETLRQCTEALRRAVSAAIKFNITYLTIDFRSATNYFSDNGVSKLYRDGLERCFHNLSGGNAGIRMVDSKNGINVGDVVDIYNCKIEVIVYIEYNAREEIAGAVRRLAEEVVGGYMLADHINVNTLSAKIGLDLPDPDLIIGMSRDQRLSNFLLWESAYAEFCFLPIDWPEFNEAAFEMAIDDYARRHRRFGGL